MTHSVRLRLVDRFHGVIDYIRENVAKRLCGCECHSKSRRNGRLEFVSLINDGAGEGQIDDAIVRPCLCEQINELNAQGIRANHPSLVHYLEHLSAPKNDFIGHSNSPQSFGGAA